ncbi:GerMN domain-containing protein [Micromonospora sp. 4G55]|nr:GerMN domain-containing protein [Micromonospora sp. 4G55]
MVSIAAALSAAGPLSAQTAALNRSASPRPWLDLTYQLLGIAFALLPVLLAVHLLARDPGDPARTLGVDLSRPGSDLARGAGLAALIGLPGLALFWAAAQLGINATLVPAGVEMVRIAEGTATVAPPESFADTDARTLRLRRAQVVWTLTQFPTVRRVAFAGSGVVLARTDLADLLAPIVVTEPAIGQRVAGPVTVAGTADVYEATVSIRILDGAGRVVGTGFTTATCGSGCRGDYRGGVAYRLATAGPGTVEVYEVSPRDGSRTHVVAVPVLLAATA